jgi:pimeloyl-ACP methyl ester carboxylesterase
MEIRVGNFVFTAEAAGDSTNPLVLLLHGFPQTNHTWREQLQPLADAGYYAVAPDQRGYSPGARPTGKENYRTDLLVADALDMASALGHERFHVVGHDWGGQLSWLLAANFPERIRSLAILSRPHPAAFRAAMKKDAAQAHRSRHHKAFQDPKTVQLLLENNAARLRRSLADQGVPSPDVDAYLSVLCEPEALECAVNWYRAAGSGGSALSLADVGEVSVPTLYIWGDADATVGRVAAEATAEFVSGPYAFEVLPNVGHFVTDQAAMEVTRLLLDHIASSRTA